MAFLEGPDDGPIPEAWIRVEMRRADYVQFMATVERLMGAMQMIGQWNGSIKPFIQDPRHDADALLQGINLMEERMTQIDAPPALPVMVEWELHQLVKGFTEIPLWEKVQAGSCDESKLDELSPMAIEHGNTYRLSVLDTEGNIRLVIREFKV